VRSSRATSAARWRRELYRSRQRLLKARERLSKRERRRLCELFEHEPLITRGVGAQGSVPLGTRRPIANRPSADSPASWRRSTARQLPAFTAFADGVRLWREELLAYFDEPTTNGLRRGRDNKIKVIKRRAYGVPTFEGFRARVRLACA